MKHPIKLLIQKKYVINEGFNRYYTVDRILINDDSLIKTEAQLCNYIYRKFGKGRFMCLAYQKGVDGFWNFWIGYLLENGFVRDTRKNKELIRLEKELRRADSYQEREDIEDEISLEKETHSNYTKHGRIARYGPYSIKKSRPGQLNSYEAL